MEIIQFIPHPPKNGGGISDYAIKLAETFLKDYQILTHFLVYETQYYGTYIEPKLKEFPVSALSASTPEALLSCFSEQIGAMIFHYNFRGEYEPSRTAFWMINALKIVQQQYSFKLILMVHELTLTFNIRRFTLPHPHQILAARGLAKMADAVLTNSTKYQKILSRWS